MSQQTKVSAQFIYDTIPPSIDCECAECQMKDIEISRLNWLIANMMEPVENIKEFKYQSNL